jgi:hypothetical protein
MTNWHQNGRGHYYRRLWKFNLTVYRRRDHRLRDEELWHWCCAEDRPNGSTRRFSRRGYASPEQAAEAVMSLVQDEKESAGVS